MKYGCLCLFHRTRKSQSGQAMFVGLTLTSLCVLAWASSYYIGHLVHDKVSLIRATDASAMSAAIIHARTLNFHSYLNRAQLAHQLAMVHLVTLASQERFRAKQAQQSQRMNPPAFVIGMFFGPSYATSYLAAQAGGMTDHLAIQSLESAFNRHDMLITEMIEQTRLNLINDLSVSRNQVVERVLLRNLGDSGSTMRADSLEALGLSYKIVRDDMKNAVQYSSIQNPEWTEVFKRVAEPYRYLGSRKKVRKNVWAVNVRCPHKRHELRRRGQTEIHQSGVYESNDSLAFHAIRSNRIIGCYQREYPMGWSLVNTGSSQVSKTDPGYVNNLSEHNFSTQSFWRWVKSQGIPGWDIFNGTENQLSNAWSHAQKIRWQSNKNIGFTNVDEESEGFRFLIKTEQSSKHLSEHKNSTGLTGKFKISGLDPVDSIRASSASITYFLRPSKRSDGSEEHASLFHPYWHARLVRH